MSIAQIDTYHWVNVIFNITSKLIEVLVLLFVQSSSFSIFVFICINFENKWDSVGLFGWENIIMMMMKIHAHNIRNSMRLITRTRNELPVTHNSIVIIIIINEENKLEPSASICKHSKCVFPYFLYWRNSIHFSIYIYLMMSMCMCARACAWERELLFSILLSFCYYCFSIFSINDGQWVCQFVDVDTLVLLVIVMT